MQQKLAFTFKGPGATNVILSHSTTIEETCIVKDKFNEL